MPKNSELVGMFGLGIKAFRRPSGKIEHQLQSSNKNIPIEIALMQVRAFLRHMEQDYFDRFDKGLSKANPK